MRKIRKATAIILLLVLAGSLFASVGSTPGSIYTKTSPRVMSMGGAGLAVFNNQDALYLNPASLAEKGLVFNLPNVSFTLYNIKNAYVDTGLIDNLIDDPSSIADTDYLANELLPDVLEILSTVGSNRLATIDAGVGMKLGRFAFAVDTQLNLNTFNENAGLSEMTVIPEINVAATFGFGFRFFRESPFNFDVGLSAALQMRAYTDLSATSFIDQIQNSDNFDIGTIFSGHPIALGWALPLTAAVNVNFPFGFTISNVVSNIHLINGGFNYIQTDYEKIKDDAAGTISSVFSDDTKTYKSSPVWSVGLGWTPEYSIDWIIKPTVAVDLVDITGLFDDFSSDSFLQRLKIGAELQFLNLFEIRAGLNGGYKSVGLGVNLFNVIHMEAAYYWNEFGHDLGEKDVDALTIRFNIGWER